MQLEKRRTQPAAEYHNEDVTSSEGLDTLGPAPLPPDWTAYRAQAGGGDHTGGLTSLGTRSAAGAAESNGTVRASNGPELYEGVLVSEPSSADPTQEAACKEILASLSVTQNAFIEALHNLIQHSFATALRSTPAARPGGSCDTSSSRADVTGQHLRASTSSTASTSQSSSKEILNDNSALAALLADVRQACHAMEDPFEGAEMRQIIATAKDGFGSVQEIRTRLNYLTPYFPDNTQSSTTTSSFLSGPQVAKNIASMLGMIQRLQTLYEESPSLASTHSFTSPLATPSYERGIFYDASERHSIDAAEGVYSALQKQAKAIQSVSLSRGESQDSSNVVRAVEEAEVELLWGRMNDLLESTVQSCKLDRIAGVARVTQDNPFGPSSSVVTNSNGFFEYDTQAALPEYSSLDPPSYEGNGHLDIDDFFEDEKGSLEAGDASATSARQRHLQARSSVSEEKMQVDLDRMASAIERLYISAPQLANQRVEAVTRNDADRQKMRELQLAKLGTAIERLCKGRLEDQRASLLQNNTVNPSASTRSRGKSKEDYSKQASLEKLLDDIDRAAGRTLDDQRVAMSSRQQHALMEARKTARLAAADLNLDEDELAFRDYIMENVSKGRLTSQDASFSLPQSASTPPTPTGFSARLAMKRRSLAHIWDDAGSSSGGKGNRGRSSSVGAVPTPPIPQIPAVYANEAATRPIIKKRFSVSRLLSSASKDPFLLNAPNGRKCARSSPSHSRPASAHSTSVSQVIYTVEEMTNLGSVILQLWEDPADEYEPPQPPKPWAISLLDGKTAQLVRPDTNSTEQDALQISLTSEVRTLAMEGKNLDLLFKADHYEVKLPTASSAQFTRSRDDLEIPVPYSAREFRKYQPTSLTCCSCSSQLANLSRITRYNDLPSEHWAELLDAWMCHPDQTLSREIIEKGNNIWPQANQALISSTGIILATDNTKGWNVAEDLEPFHASDGKWLAAKCKACRALVGRSSPGPTRALTESSAYVRFSKFAIQPAITSLMPVYSLSLHVTTSLLETSLARAIHRFIIEDEEEGSSMLVLWLFNPFVRIFSNHSSFDSSSPVNATKILYKAGPLQDHDVNRLLGNAEYETVLYPRGVCLQLADLLQSSTAIYPASHQKLGEWSVGWLERDVGRA